MKHKINDFSLKELSQGFTRETPYKILVRGFPHFDEVRLHYHDSLEFNIYQGIEGQVFLNGREYSLSDHSLLILPPGIMHSYIIPPQEGQMVIVQISFRELLPYINAEQIARVMGIQWERIPYFTPRLEISRLCYNLMEKKGCPIPDFLIWIIELFRAISLLDRGESTLSTSPLEMSWLRKAISYTESHFERKISLDQMARVAGYSPAYFSRLFKKHTGLNYWDYLQTVRLERATKLLEQGVSVSETAELSGFQDVSYFIKVFRENRGNSPGQYYSMLSKKSSLE